MKNYRSDWLAACFGDALTDGKTVIAYFNNGHEPAEYGANFGYGGFWKTEELPEGVKPIKALSNGSIVTCYFRTLGDRIEIYRPNPNAREVYKPLSTNLHIMHQRIYGIY